MLAWVVVDACVCVCFFFASPRYACMLTWVLVGDACVGVYMRVSVNLDRQINR